MILKAVFYLLICLILAVSPSSKMKQAKSSSESYPNQIVLAAKSPLSWISALTTLVEDFQPRFVKFTSGAATQEELLPHFEAFARGLAKLLDLDEVKLLELFRDSFNQPRDSYFLRRLEYIFIQINNYIIQKGVVLRLNESEEDTKRIGLACGILDPDQGIIFHYLRITYHGFYIKKWLNKERVNEPGLSIHQSKIILVDPHALLSLRKYWRIILSLLQSPDNPIEEESSLRKIKDEFGSLNFFKELLATVLKDEEDNSTVIKETLDHEVKHAQDFIFLTDRFGPQTDPSLAIWFAKLALQPKGRLYETYNSEKLHAAEKLLFSSHTHELSPYFAQIYNSLDPKMTIYKMMILFLSVGSHEMKILFTLLIEEIIDTEEDDFSENLVLLFNKIKTMKPDEIKETLKTIYEREFILPFGKLEWSTTDSPFTGRSPVEIRPYNPYEGIEVSL